MALVPKHYAKNQHLVPGDAIYELRRARARVRNKPDDLIRHIVDNDSLDEVYKHMLLCLLTADDRAVLRKEKMGKNVVVEQRKKHVAPKKRKRNESITDRHDGRGKGKGKMGKNDVEQRMKHVVPKKRKRNKSIIDRHDGRGRGKEKMGKNDVVEHREKCVVPKKRKRNESIIDRHDARGRGRVSEKNKLLCVKKGTGVIKNLVKKEKQCDRINAIGENGVASKALVSLGNNYLHHEDNKGNIPLIHYQGEFVAQARPVKISRKQVGGKLKGVVKEEYEANEMIVVKKENEKIYLDRRSRSCVTRNLHKDVGQVQLGKKHAVRGESEKGLMKVVRGDNGLASKKIVIGNFAIKKEPDVRVETRLPIEGIHSRTKNVKCAKCSMAYKNNSEKYKERRDSSKTVPEVEILDNDMVVKAGIFSPFIPSIKFDSSMADKMSKNLGLPTAKDEFRKELLKVLRKPYDKEEHQKIREAIPAGSYRKYHQGLQKKLKKYQYKREKRLVLLRGFMFWLQNLTREGAFKPWKDKQCLAVEISSC